MDQGRNMQWCKSSKKICQIVREYGQNVQCLHAPSLFSRCPHLAMIELAKELTEGHEGNLWPRKPISHLREGFG